MAVDVLVKYKNFPALEIELDNNSLKHDYKTLLKKNSQQLPISRDPCKYTLEYFSVLTQQAKDILKWNWIRDQYSLKDNEIKEWQEKSKTYSDSTVFEKDLVFNMISTYGSVKKILSLPDTTRLFMCHDYPPNNRPVAFETTVAEQRKHNIHVHDGISEDQFVKMRTERDATLEMPVLILPSVQVNIRAGEMPPKDDNGIAYLKIPVNAL
jgi:hypothetical protein